MMIPKVLLNTQMICKMFMKILQNTIHVKNKVLVVFDDRIADIINNKKLNLIETKLFIRGRKINISIVFITQLYFKAPKEVRHFFL